MTKEELIAKYWKKNLPGAEGSYNTRFIEMRWKKDKGDKISKKDLDVLLNDLKKNAR